MLSFRTIASLFAFIITVHCLSFRDLSSLARRLGGIVLVFQSIANVGSSLDLGLEAMRGSGGLIDFLGVLLVGLIQT